MRRLLLAAVIAAGPALAEPSEFLKGAELQAEVAKLCADGCIVFSAAEIEALKANIAAHIRAQQDAIFAAGQARANETCRNRIGFLQ